MPQESAQRLKPALIQRGGHARLKTCSTRDMSAVIVVGSYFVAKDFLLNAPTASPDQHVSLKKAAAEYAVRYIESGMTVGLGTGSTAIFAIQRIGALLQSGGLKDIVGFATSRASWDAAGDLNIPMLADDLPQAIDVTIDGADEVDPQLNLVKGGGGHCCARSWSHKRRRAKSLSLTRANSRRGSARCMFCRSKFFLLAGFRQRAFWSLWGRSMSSVRPPTAKSIAPTRAT
jgi:hypothetical protein